MSRILKRGEIWYIDYQYKGKRIRQSLNTTSKKIAELALKNFDVQSAKEELNIASPRKVNFSEFSKRFLDWYEVQNSEKTARDYVNLLIQHLFRILKTMF